MSQFGVDPDTLTDLAGKFDREARGLAVPIESFAATASEVGEAFGLLGACDGAAERYQKLLTSTLEALGHLPGVLGSDGDRLRTNAANYKDSDQAAVRHLHAATQPAGGPA
ncbi:WXG100 family type VII secretion target [Streptomyces sp. Ru72]|uniref:WXG100 family type VII secretion target n=1 Tax=Streptomyces sp. Ru72 TaxID=2080747 RepID=UPI000CDE1658|nr:type VII secretion target [Streptomyces sp. Ru72]POX44853.1 ESX-1 secretion-associated protein [Streptomyces sp. Ru72]